MNGTDAGRQTESHPGVELQKTTTETVNGLTVLSVKVIHT